MLSKMFIEYEDGLQVEKVVHNSETSFKTKSIKHASCQPFKYEVEKHAYLCIAIVQMGNIKKIMPAGIVCHPKTTLEDIIEIDNTPIEKPEPKPREKRTWKFESSSSEGFYQVTENMGKLKCNCMGFFRSRGNCKHIKEVEKELGIVK